MELIHYKICLIGDAGVGKTSIMEALSGYTRSLGLGVAFDRIQLEIDKNHFDLMIWEIPPLDLIKDRPYLKGSHGAIYIFDITNKSSLKDIDFWINIFRKETENKEVRPPILIVGNKIDLKGKREVKIREVEELAEKYQFLNYMESSAKTGENVKELFQTLACEIYERSF